VIRAVLDANQFASALLKPGSNPARILDSLKDNKFQLIISESIVNEIKRILLYPKLKKIHGLEAGEIEAFLDDLAAFAFFTPEELEVTVVPEDPSDNKYFICAAEGEAGYLVSGDNHLLRLGSWQSIKVITARDFLELLA